MRKQLEQLRTLMERENIDVYLVTMEDDHQSEYVCSHFKEIAFVSGFTGSAGTLVVAKDDAGLWTDGRYFVQAGSQLAGTGVRLMKAGVEGTPSVEAFILEHIPHGGTLGFCGQCVSDTEIRAVLKKLRSKAVKAAYEQDLPGMIWQDRPAKTCEPCLVMEEKYPGMS